MAGFTSTRYHNERNETKKKDDSSFQRYPCTTGTDGDPQGNSLFIFVAFCLALPTYAFEGFIRITAPCIRFGERPSYLPILSPQNCETPTGTGNN